MPTPSDLWRDYIVAEVRDAPIESKSQREFVARFIERHWRSDPKFDRRQDRADKARVIRAKLREMTTTRTPLAEKKTLAEAKKTLARDYEHNSVEALNKWLRRNLRGPRLPTSR